MLLLPHIITTRRVLQVDLPFSTCHELLAVALDIPMSSAQCFDPFVRGLTVPADHIYRLAAPEWLNKHPLGATEIIVSAAALVREHNADDVFLREGDRRRELRFEHMIPQD